MSRAEETDVQPDREGSQRTGGTTPDTATASGSTPRGTGGTGSQREVLLSELEAPLDCSASRDANSLDDVPMRRTRSAPRHGPLTSWVAPEVPALPAHGIVSSRLGDIQSGTPGEATRAAHQEPNHGHDAYTDRRPSSATLPSRRRRSISVPAVGHDSQARASRNTPTSPAAVREQHGRSVYGRSVLDQGRGRLNEGECC